jgi:signal transduction histidine kinase
VLNHEEPYLAVVERTKNQYSVPLRRGERVVGVLMVGMPVLDGLPDHHRSSISAAAAHCAAAIASAKRFQQEQAVRQLATDLMARAIALLERPTPSRRAVGREQDGQPLAMLRQFQTFLREYHRLRTTAETTEPNRASTIDLVQFTRDYLSGEICAALLSQSTPRLEITFSSDAVTLPVYADQVSLTTILHALVVNAVEASEDTSGGISIHCRMKTKAFRGRNIQFGFLCVRDNGTGIFPEDQGKLFQIGYSRKKGHLGLGLPLAQNTAAVLGGSVLLQPASEHGATFCLSLPLAEQGALA